MAKNNSEHILRLAAVHDICGYGKCSLGIVLPILSALNIEVCPMPTGIFSMQTEIDGYEHLDISKFLPKYLASWTKHRIKFDAIYSGFINSESQIELISKLYTENLYSLRILDPVMGDFGRLYKTYTKKMCSTMRKLVASSDILTPNLTEASILLNIEYNAHPNDTQIKYILNGLKNMGANGVVLKGAKIQDGNIFNYIIDREGNISTTSNKYYNYQIHGSGDLYCSVLSGLFINGYSLQKSAELAGCFVAKAVELTTHQPGFKQRGISFEPLIGDLIALIK